MKETIVRECSCGSTCDFTVSIQYKDRGYGNFERIDLHDNFDEWQAWVREHRAHGIREMD